MFCANCGTSINDDVVFCPACGKPAKAVVPAEVPGYSPPQPQVESIQSPSQTVVFAPNMYSGNANYVPKRYYPLTTLAGKMFPLFFEIFLWITLLIGAICGGIIGADASGGLGAFAGVIIGIAIAFIGIIVFGGLYSIIMKINANIEELNRKT